LNRLTERSAAPRTREAVDFDVDVLSTALDFLERWAIAQPIRLVRVSLKVAARDLGDPTFADSFVRELAGTAVPASRLQLDLTDRFDKSQRASIGRTVTALRSHGVRIALDNFGRHPNDLCVLSDLDFDTIKLAPHLIRDDVDGHCAALLRSLLRLARQAGLDVVAKGVELPDQHERLLRAGCAFGQGPLYGHPEPNAISGPVSLATTSVWQGLESTNKRARAIEAIIDHGALDDGSVDALINAAFAVNDASVVLFATNEPAPNRTVYASTARAGADLPGRLAGHVRCACEASLRAGEMLDLTGQPDGERVVGAQIVDAEGIVLGALIVVTDESPTSRTDAWMAQLCDRLVLALQRDPRLRLGAPRSHRPERACA
jgi:EAL domain-containing protein (putative c-di-GMP-specific phosphodiesterase class I)